MKERFKLVITVGLVLLNDKDKFFCKKGVIQDIWMENMDW